jgi:hypothetical protein
VSDLKQDNELTEHVKLVSTLKIKHKKRVKDCDKLTKLKISMNIRYQNDCKKP